MIERFASRTPCEAVVAHGEAFREHPPATSMVEVSGMIDPRMCVEIEAVAYDPRLA